MKKLSVLSVLLLAACVTINIYFPAAAAEKAADEIIKGIQKEQTQPQLKPEGHWSGQQLAVYPRALWYRTLDAAINVLISPAQADADLNIDSPEIRQISSAMQNRFQALSGLYTQGIIGILADGMIGVRDSGAVQLKDRNSVNQWVGAENADRMRLYQAIANANGHPEWLEQIKSTFAARWVTNAQSGWWYQTSNGSWKQK